MFPDFDEYNQELSCDCYEPTCMLCTNWRPLDVAENSSHDERSSPIRFETTPDEMNTGHALKRQKNAEAARKCREKIRQRTECLERELAYVKLINEQKNRIRQDLLKLIETEFSHLKLLIRKSPELEWSILTESREIVNSYQETAEINRQKIKLHMVSGKKSGKKKKL